LLLTSLFTTIGCFIGQVILALIILLPTHPGRQLRAGRGGLKRYGAGAAAECRKRQRVRRARRKI
jgi:hypothetical protein